MPIENPTYYKIVGSTAITELPKKRRWDLQNGVQTFRRFVGSKPVIEEKFNELSAAGIAAGIDDLDEDIDGYSGRLLARIYEDSGGEAGGNTEETNAIWELYGQDIYNPMETHSNYNDITGERKRDIGKYVTDKEAAIADGISAPSGAAELALAGYLSHQSLDYLIGQYILRKTTTLSSRSAIKASHASVYRVVTLASIAPPTVLLGILTNLQKEDGTTGAWEWLKKPPQIIQVTRTKFQLRYEFWGAEKWAALYGGSWSPSYS